MSAKIIDGNKIAEAIKQWIKAELEKLKENLVLVAVQVGENPASRVYIKNQKSSCEEIGIQYNLVQFDSNISEDNLISEIKKLGQDEKITGIILQMPLPNHINSRKIQMSIPEEKDVEGVTPANLGKLLYADVQPTVAPCTALSVMECIKSTGENIKGKEAVIVGHSEIVGKPVTLMLLSSLLDSATPTVCHIATKDLAIHTKRAEILIVAVGKPGLIKGDMIKKGAIVIDVGINRIQIKDEKGEPVIDDKTGKPKMKTVGDVVFDEAKEIAGYITPVPGGVGAVTTVMLIKNLVNLYKSESAS
ncbi:MAG: bifunctional 5,10-methylene-tetrahydrofolate dehydrogenase/5,10-methylene-tetrahydrofolate cyclohydrolase [Elusimicrobia bacterium CG06_land_8_20_14_3_00_38_11]|nr:MAG: bifunctional 5,10-methylene-tetrahydrofolate dehydrogenase/5,10-methylene-tetrahydrofolate cyclohydrolase [Elusimicrobia bacterium CG06_land_8_20_14_3_00_38_11]